MAARTWLVGVWVLAGSSPFLIGAEALAQSAPLMAPAYTPPPAVAASPQKMNSINASPLGVLLDSYSLNFEHLVNGTHGLMAEGKVYFSSGTASSGTETSSSKATTYGGVVGYRWHCSRKQQSVFLGLMGGYTVGNGSSTITTGGTSQTFDLTIKAPRIVGNIGYRWQWDSGINLTLRIGGGLAKYTVSSTSTDPDAKGAVKSLQDVLTRYPIALDGELSVGYTF